MSFDILAVGKALGKKKIDLRNQFKENVFNRIYNTTGVKYLYKLSEKQNLQSLNLESYQNLICKTKVDLESLDLIISVNQTSEYMLPGIANIIASKIKAKKNVICIDLSSGCSGFVQALDLADKYFISGIKSALIFCSDAYSRIIDESDKSTYLLFSDCSTATYLKRNKYKKSISSSFGNDGENFQHLSCSNKIIDNNTRPSLVMNGTKVYQFTLSKVIPSLDSFLKKNYNYKIKFLLLHQASKLVLETFISKLNLEKSKVPMNLSTYGNTVSSSIPLVVEDLITNKSIKKGEYIILCGFGVGLSWGMILYEW